MPTPEDFGLELSPTAQTTAYTICSEPKSRFPTDTWAATSEPDFLFVRYDPQVLLVLKRRRPYARPSPSFDCARAITPTEGAICKSFTLAAWDRSVALALKQVSQMFPERSDKLKQSQEQWVRERNACGANGQCIEDSLRNRVAVLVWERKT